MSTSPSLLGSQEIILQQNPIYSPYSRLSSATKFSNQGFMIPAKQPPPADIHVLFLTVLSDFLAGQISVQQAVEDWLEICEKLIISFKEGVDNAVVGSKQHKNAVKLLMQVQDELGTWQLLKFLWMDDTPAGMGGLQYVGISGEMAIKQQIASLVNLDPELQRCAKVLAWLEHRADCRMQSEQFKHGVKFHNQLMKNQGYWKDTKIRATASVSAGYISEFDFDAPFREKCTLSNIDCGQEDEIMQQVWQLIRAGRWRDIPDFMQYMGIPWRIAAFMGGGNFGPLPVGTTALEQDQLTSSEDGVVSQIEFGGSASWSLWKRSCLSAGKQIYGCMGDVGFGSYESAVYGSLAGSIKLCLPVCSTWEDVLWTFVRAYLQLTTDRLLPKPNVVSKSEVSINIVRQALQNLDNGAISEENIENLQNLTEWPPQELLERLPGSLEQVIKTVSQLQQPPTVPTEIDKFQRQIQSQLILGNYDRKEDLDTMDQEHEGYYNENQVVGGEGQRGGILEMLSGSIVEQQSQQMDKGNSLRFCAHCAIAMVFLGCFQEELSLEGKVSIDKILNAYIWFLFGAQQQQQYQLYLPHIAPLLSLLSRGARQQAMFQIMSELTERLQRSEETISNYDDEEEEGGGEQTDLVLQRCLDFFNFTYKCFSSQQKISQADYIPEIFSQLEEDLSGDSMRRICYEFVDQTRLDFSKSSDYRVCSFRWFSFYFQLSMSNELEQKNNRFLMDSDADIGSDEITQENQCWTTDALQIVLFMCRDFALGNDDTHRSAHRLLINIDQVQILEKVSEIQEWQQQLRVAELHCWKDYFHIMSNFLQFNNRIQSIKQQYSAHEKDILSQQGAELLDWVIQILKSQWLSQIQSDLISAFKKVFTEENSQRLVYQLFVTMQRDDRKLNLSRQFLDQLCSQLQNLYQNKLAEIGIGKQIKIEVQPHVLKEQEEGVGKVVITYENKGNETTFQEMKNTYFEMAKILTHITLNEWKLSGLGSLLVLGAQQVQGDSFGIVAVCLNHMVCTSNLCQVAMLCRQQLLEMGAVQNTGDELLEIIAQEKFCLIVPVSRMQWILQTEREILKQKTERTIQKIES